MAPFTSRDDRSSEAAGEFIFTDGAKGQIAKIHIDFQTNTPIVLECVTKTSTTRSIHIICTLLRKELVRLSCSTETVAEGILGRLVSDPDGRSSEPSRTASVGFSTKLTLHRSEFLSAWKIAGN